MIGFESSLPSSSSTWNDRSTQIPQPLQFFPIVPSVKLDRAMIGTSRPTLTSQIRRTPGLTEWGNASVNAGKLNAIWGARMSAISGLKNDRWRKNSLWLSLLLSHTRRVIGPGTICAAAGVLSNVTNVNTWTEIGLNIGAHLPALGLQW